MNRLGGVLRLRHESDAMYLDWIQLEQYGVYSTQPIEFGLNLLNYTETITADDIVTALIPLGATIEEEVPEGEADPPQSVLDKRVDITSVNGGKNFIVNQDAVNEFGWIWATNTWDDVHLPENLLEKARNYLAETQFERLTLTLSAADLSELGNDYNAFSEGDRIHCLARPYGMDIVLPVQKLTIPLTNPAGRTLELSNSRTQTYTESNNKNISNATQNAIDKANSNSKVLNKEIQTSIDNLTQMMNQGKGGYKVTEYDEDGRWLRDLYMDAPDKDLATNIMMINEFGIGFSTTGYNGPYTTGITIDGTILGSRLVANSVSADKLSVGLNATIQGLEDGIKTTVKKDELISEINQSSESILISASKVDIAASEAFNSVVQKDELISEINQSAEGIKINASKLELESDTLSISTQNNEKSATIRLLKNGVEIDSDTLTFTGVATYNDLKNTGQTVINGSNITTGTIDVNRVKLYNEMTVYTGSGSTTVGGKIGYTSSANDGTAGIRLFKSSGSTSGECVATANGAKLTSTDSSRGLSQIYITQNNAGIGFRTDRSDSLWFYFDYINEAFRSANKCYLGTSGSPWGQIYSTNSAVSTSDERKKNSIEALPEAYLDMFDRLEPVRYKLNDGTSDRYHVGMIAQQVEKAMGQSGIRSKDFGGLVKGTDEETGEEHYYLRYEEFIGVLIAKIKRLERRIENLEGVN